MTDLVEQLKVARSRLSTPSAGWPTKAWSGAKGSPGDGRGQFAVLTDEGMAVLERAAPEHVVMVRAAVFDRLTPEQVAVFGEVCRIVVAGLSGPDRPGAGDLPWRR